MERTPPTTRQRATRTALTLAGAAAIGLTACGTPTAPQANRSPWLAPHATLDAAHRDTVPKDTTKKVTPQGSYGGPEI